MAKPTRAKAHKHRKPAPPSGDPQRSFIAYYRVSTRAQGRSGLGIDAQREAIQRFLDSEGEGQSPLASFTELESGRRNDRPQLAKALAACRAHRATLVVAKVDRLARSQAFLESIIASGARVRFCDLPEIRGATGRFMLRQMASVAELEADFIGERTKAALAAKVERDGQWDRKAKHHLVAGAGQAAAVVALKDQANKRAEDLADFIGQLQRDGTGTLREIAEGLNRANVPTPRGGTWGPSNVRNVLARLPQ
jgi:DNA invertase Pin-like site-specific DNA recombinase